MLHQICNFVSYLFFVAPHNHCDSTDTCTVAEKSVYRIIYFLQCEIATIRMNQYRKTMNQQSLTQESHTVPCERGDTMSKWKVACIGVIALTHLYGLLYMISKSLDTSSLATNSPAGDTTMQARAASCLQDPVEKYTPHQYLMCTTSKFTSLLLSKTIYISNTRAVWQPECSLPYDRNEPSSLHWYSTY